MAAQRPSNTYNKYLFPQNLINQTGINICNMFSIASCKLSAGEDGSKSNSNSNSSVESSFAPTSSMSSSMLARSHSVVEVRGMKTNSAHDGTDAALKVNNHKEEGITSDTECSTVSDSLTNEDHSIRYRHRKQLLPFPIQLMDLIENESVDENAATVNGNKALEWLPTGDKFIIRDRRTMERCVLPKYFNNNCKFMSFVRKLYRWGFRQVEKNASGAMIFFNKKFIRGDAKKCLDMRSTVKRPPLASTVIASSPPNRCQSYGNVEVGAAQNAGGVMASHLLLNNRQGIYNSNASMWSEGRFVFNTTVGGGANLGYSPQPNRHYNAFESMLINQSQRLSYNIMMGSADTNTNKVSHASSAAEAAAALHANQDYNITLSQPNSVVSMRGNQEVIMASLIMDEYPSLDARQALQVAKGCLNGTSTSITRRSPW